MKAIHFGAGSIGRGFIADLLHDSGYEITLVDVNEQLNHQINQTHSYHLYVIEEHYQEKTIDRVKALSPIKETEQVIQDRLGRYSYDRCMGRQPVKSSTDDF